MRKSIGGLSCFPALFCLLTAFQAAAQEITIGLMADLTGPSATNGEDCRRGYEVAKSFLIHDDLAGQHKVRIVYGDHQGNAKTGVSEFNRLVNADKAWVVATSRSQIGMALNPLSAKRHIPLLGTVGHDQFVSENPYAWRFFPSAAAEASALARKALQMGLKRAAILTIQDEWTLALARAFRENFVKGGGEIVYFEALTPPDYDLASVISRIRTVSPDAIMTGFSVSDSGLAIRKLREQGLHQQIFANIWATKQEALTEAGNAAEGMIVAEPDLRKARFTSALQKLFHNDFATAITYSCYAALSAALQAVSALPAQGVRLEGFERALREMKELKLADETLPINGRELQYQLVYKTVTSGNVTYLTSVQNPGKD